MNLSFELLPLTPARAKSSTSPMAWLLQAKMVAPVSSARPSLNLALVIDRSGSMGALSPSGKTALEEAKEAALALIMQLEDRDRVAIVAYDSTVSVVLASMDAAAAKRQAPAALAAVQLAGATALHAGWLTGAQQVAPFVGDYGVTRVVVLSDGQANSGVTDPQQFHLEAEKLYAAGISTSTYGLSLGFNELLMTQLAVGGMACYAQSATELAPYFNQEFSILASTLGQNVEVELEATTATGEKVSVSALRLSSAANGWKMANLINDAWSWGVFETAPVTEEIRCKATLRWKDLEGNYHSRVLEVAQPLRARAGKENTVVAERVREVQAAALADEAAAAAREQDQLKLQAAVTKMSTLSASNACVRGVADNLSALAASGNFALAAKEAMYGSVSLSTRQVDADEDHTTLAADRLGLRKAFQGKATSKKGE